MDATQRLDAFLEAVSEADGHAALSDAKMRCLGLERQVVTISDEGELVAVGVAATHRQSDGSVHWGVETVVARAMRFPAFEDETLARALQLVPRGVSMSVWSTRPSLDVALVRAGFDVVRSIAHMAVPLPLEVTTDLAVDRFTVGSEQRLLAINHATFGAHREAGALDESELASVMSERWFEPAGILFHQIDGIDAAFCWTKIHENGDGEIYRIGVDPRFERRGLGREIVVAGYGHLAGNRGARRGTLWVDESNVAAKKLYERLGLRVQMRNREFARPEA